jgi:hypothetical protein
MAIGRSISIVEGSIPLLLGRDGCSLLRGNVSEVAVAGVVLNTAITEPLPNGELVE